MAEDKDQISADDWASAMAEQEPAAGAEAGADADADWGHCGPSRHSARRE